MYLQHILLGKVEIHICYKLVYCHDYDEKIAINSQSHIKRVAITIKVYKPTLQIFSSSTGCYIYKNSLSVIAVPIYFVPASISKYSMPSSYDQLVAYDNGWLFGTPFHGHSTLSNGMFSFEK